MIEMKDVMKKYSNGTTAIRNLSIVIEQGEFVYVVGPSGAGKSTFIKLMYREEKASKGTLNVAGHDLIAIKNREVPYLRREIGVVFQDYKLLPRKTVYENVAYAMQVIGRKPRDIKKRVMEVLDLVGLKHKVRVFPSELSGGEQQRVSIARAIVNTPKVLIADEPTGNLDPENSWEIMKLLDRINAQGTTVVMATHNSTIVNTIRHRVIAIENGRIIRDQAEGNMDTMIRTFFRHLLESIKSLKRNGWMTVASVSAVTITLTLVGVFMAVIMNATKLAQDIEGNVDVSVFVDIGTKDEEMKKLEKELNDLDHVKKVEFSSKEQELKKIQNEMGDSWKLFEGDNNPLYDVYVVSATDPSYTKQVAEEAADLKNVSRSDYGGASSDRIFQIAGAVRTWGLVAAALLLFVAMFLISNTIRITILSRQREIQIMRLVGAKNGYIRWPFFLEGGWIGLIGAILPILIITFGYAWFFQLINPSLLRSHYSLIHPQNIVWKINLLMVGIGVIIGSLGSIISMRRFLKF